MPKITLEDTHSLVEKLVEYVTNEVAKKSEVDEIKTEVKGLKTEVNGIKIEVNGLKLEVNEIKKDVKDNKQKINIILNGQDKIAKQLDNIRTEQAATNSALLRHEERITALEQK